MTLAQVIGTPVVLGTPTVAPIKLEQVTVASSPLGGIPLGGIALGALPLGGIPLGGIATSTPEQNRADWCAFINEQPGFESSCPNGDSLIGQTMLGLALRGVPLGGIPLGGIPLGGIPLGGIPLGGIAVSTPLGGIPLGGIDLTGTPLGGIPLGGIPLGGIDMSVWPLGGITLDLIPAAAKSAIFNCPTGNFICADTDTLAEAKAAGAIKATARIEDLGYYKTANGQYITLAQFVQGLPDDTMLGDLLATILLETAYDWEKLPLPGFPIQDFSADGGIANYSVSFTVSGAPGDVDGTVHVHLPEQARYVEGSTELTGGPGVETDEPTLDLPENELTWSVTGIAPGTPYTLGFQGRPGLSLGTESATAKLAATGLGPPVSAPEPASTQLTEPGEPGNGEPANRAADSG